MKQKYIIREHRTTRRELKNNEKFQKNILSLFSIIGIIFFIYFLILFYIYIKNI